MSRLPDQSAPSESVSGAVARKSLTRAASWGETVTSVLSLRSSRPENGDGAVPSSTVGKARGAPMKSNCKRF